jgi:hypothetical protein
MLYRSKMARPVKGIFFFSHKHNTLERKNIHFVLFASFFSSTCPVDLVTTLRAPATTARATTTTRPVEPTPTPVRPIIVSCHNECIFVSLLPKNLTSRPFQIPTATALTTTRTITALPITTPEAVPRVTPRPEETADLRGRNKHSLPRPSCIQESYVFRVLCRMYQGERSTCISERFAV